MLRIPDMAPAATATTTKPTPILMANATAGSNSSASTSADLVSLPPARTTDFSSSSSSSQLVEPKQDGIGSNENTKINNINIVITSLIAGAIAGGLAKTAIAPLDRAKINFQINKDIPYSFRGAALFLKHCLQNEGFSGLWRGNSATMARIIPYAAIQFTAHEQFRKILRVDQDESTKFRRFLAGSFAGITSQSLTYPLDLARARMAVTDKYSGYTNLKQVFVKMYQCEGTRAFYRGYWPTVLGVIPYAGMSFFTYDTLKREYTEQTGIKKPHTMISLAFGACAGIVGQTSSYPLDIVRRRMQTAGIKKRNGGQDPYKTIVITLRKIYKEEGVKNGFFKGLSMNWIKGPIAVGISFSTYDHIRETLRELMGLHAVDAESSHETNQR